MIKNYLKASLAALWHRKLISLLTLFSIAISLVVVICIASYWNMLSSPMRPEINKARTFYLQMSFFRKDNHERVSYYEARELIPESFYEKDICQFGAEHVTYFTGWESVREFIKEGQARKFYFRNTDSRFFDIFDFDFVDGKPYSETMLEKGREVCVISEEAAHYFFGTIHCSGMEISTGNRGFIISGVFKQPPQTTPVTAEVYMGIPSTGIKNELRFADPGIVFLCQSKNEFELLNKGLKNLGIKYSMANEKFEVQMEVKTSVDKLIAKRYESRPLDKIRYISIVLLILILPFVSLFELLKNNLNSRMEELGVRKAFGASNVKIIKQLIFENVLVTLLGGMIGLIMAFFFFKLISGNSMANLAPVFFDWRAFIYYLSTFILMGVIAGIVPAIQFSKMSVVKALNQNQS